MSGDKRIFFYNGPVLQTSPEISVLKNGFLLVEEGKIADFGEWTGNASRIPEGVEEVDLAGNLLMPGLINAHSHVAMTIFRGLGDDMALMDWLNNCIFPAEKHLNDDWVKWGTKLGCLEMIRSGTIMVNDMYLFMDSAVEAFLESGMRAMAGEGVYDFPSPSVGAADEAIALIIERIKKWQKYPLIEPVMVAHSTYTCSPELLMRVHDVAREYGVRLHIHLAESENEVDIVTKAHNMRPVAYLDSLGVVDENLLAAHMVHLSPEEIAIVAQKGGHVLHCPESNMKLSSGFAPVGRYLDNNINVALGTDGCASNNNLDMFREMSFAAKIHKGYSGDPVKMGCDDVLKMATINGARALGVGDETGSIEVGKSADLIVVDFSSAHMRPVYNYASHLVYAASGDDVCHTMVAGKWLLKDHEFVTLDAPEIFGHIDRIAREVITAIK